MTQLTDIAAFQAATKALSQSNVSEDAILFAIRPCSLGLVLVAINKSGLCAILIGDNAKTLAADLQTRFPKAELIEEDIDCAPLVARVAAFVDDSRSGFDLPLDVQGTDFEVEVWQAIMEIPAGQTASYGEIARRMGAEGAHRAVARACGANRLAVVIPCHRVVRSDGGLSGYRWGVERKRALLNKEAA